MKGLGVMGCIFNVDKKSFCKDCSRSIFLNYLSKFSRKIQMHSLLGTGDNYVAYLAKQLNEIGHRV